MKKGLVLIVMSFLCLSVKAQTDSISLTVDYFPHIQEFAIYQEINYTNTTNKTLHQIPLHAWMNAFSSRKTELNSRKLEDRNTNLYFSTKKERGWFYDYHFTSQNRVLEYKIDDLEFISLYLKEPLEPGESTTIVCSYRLKIPKDKVTQYGYNQQHVVLKYWMLQPATFIGDAVYWQHYIDLDQVRSRPTYYDITLYNLPTKSTLESNLKVTENHIEGLSAFPVSIEFIEPQRTFYTNTFQINEKTTEVVITYPIEEKQQPYLDSILTHQLKFLYENFNTIPEKIYLNQKNKKQQNFSGIDDVDALLFKLKLFEDDEILDLNLFQRLMSSVLENSLATEKNSEHWLNNGLLVFYQLKYLEQNYNDRLLMGNIPESVSLFNMHPLQFFYASKVPLKDRFRLGYLFILRQNFDQAISTPYDELNNLNLDLISAFKTGITFNFANEYLGNDEFMTLSNSFIQENFNKKIPPKQFEEYIEKNSSKDMNWLFEELMTTKSQLNFNLTKSEVKSDSIILGIKNKKHYNGPFLIVAYKKNVPQDSIWCRAPQKVNKIGFPKGDYDKFAINPDYLFPEYNDRDNYITTKGLFRNNKKLQIRPYGDLDNPEYSQLYFSPKFSFNDYDKLILGMRLYNFSPLGRNFTFSVVPSYSTGTGDLTGSAKVKYNFFPEKGLFRVISTGGGFKYFHYDIDLSYQKYNASISVGFNKKPRSDINQSIGFFYNKFNRETNAFTPVDELPYSKYSLYELVYGFQDNKKIHEISFSSVVQVSEDFQKMFGEAFYRWEFAQNKFMSFRWFGGFFLTNKSNTPYFNFGVSRVSDYSFSLSLLGRSNDTGVFSQQYVQSEGGFKSIFDTSVNQWITSAGVYIPIWKMFDLYADAGTYKNKYQSAEFIYDSGIRMRIIPDFLELYFPIQSSLGFELNKKDYLNRIRFTFNLNISSVINTLRRGWY